MAVVSWVGVRRLFEPVDARNVVFLSGNAGLLCLHVV